jgi:predicted transcriptional regulator
MKAQVTVETLRDLIRVSGVGIVELAQRMGLNQGTVSNKINGERPMFIDEIGPITAAINDAGRMRVKESELVELVGRTNLKVRGYLTAEE